MFANDGSSNERPGIEELYELATNASNLRQEADRRGAADVLRDVAMSTDKLGAALRRLRSQWEAVEKPTRQRTRSVKEWLAMLPVRPDGQYPVRDQDGNTRMVTRQQAAEIASQEERERHNQWYARELNRLAARLAELPAVRDAVTIQAVKWGMEHAAEKAAAVVRYWLEHKCPTCDGTQWELVPGTNRQSTKPCNDCGGKGELEVPHGQEGRRLANHMDQCLHRHKQNLKARRKAFQAIPPLQRLAKRPDPKADED